MPRFHYVYIALGCLAAAIHGAAWADTPIGVTFHHDTLYRTDARGDNWCMTWAADGAKYTAMCDGNWLGEKQSYHNRLYRITGGPDGFERADVPAYPALRWGEASWFGYGIVAIGDTLYATLSKTPQTRWSGPFRGIKLIASHDNGATWARLDRHGQARPMPPDDPAWNEVNSREMFFFEEFGLPHQEQVAYPFSFAAFAQHGQANAQARDEFIYIYSPEGAHAHRLLLARAPKDRLAERSAWTYFKAVEDGQPVWTADIAQRGAVHTFPEKSSEGHYFGWYSWLPSVVWNEGLGRYIMVNGGTYGGRTMTNSDKDYFDAWMHTRTGSLGFWHAEHPWGPWTEFFYTEYWTADDDANLTYQPKLSPKWISEDGKQMVLIWSDAMRDANGRSHTVNYTWNHMRITIETD